MNTTFGLANSPELTLRNADANAEVHADPADTLALETLKVQLECIRVLSLFFPVCTVVHITFARKLAK